MGKMHNLAHSMVILTVEHRHSIVVISNQKLSKELEEWKQKTHLIAASVGQYHISLLTFVPAQPKVFSSFRMYRSEFSQHLRTTSTANRCWGCYMH